MSNYPLIEDVTARNAVVEKVLAARKKGINTDRAGHALATDWRRAPWLAEGERAVGVCGGFSNMIIHQPHTNGRSESQNMLRFYGSTGVLVHEEFYSPEVEKMIGFAQ